MLDIVSTSDSSLTVLAKVKKVAEKFQKAFEMFSKCHNMYDSSFLMSDDDIDKLGIHSTFHIFNFIILF